MINNNQKIVAQAGKFAVVGILNTVIDYIVLNLLVFFGFTAFLFVFGEKFLIANIISVSVAMINSFILNKQWTFKSQGGSIYLEIFKFLIITVIGMFIVHQIIFNLFYYRFGFISDFIIQALYYLKLTFFSREFILLNFSKSVAVVGSLIWNFFGYKFIVFKRSNEENV